MLKYQLYYVQFPDFSSDYLDQGHLRGLPGVCANPGERFPWTKIALLPWSDCSAAAVGHCLEAGGGGGLCTRYVEVVFAVAARIGAWRSRASYERAVSGRTRRPPVSEAESSMDAPYSQRLSWAEGGFASSSLSIARTGCEFRIVGGGRVPRFIHREAPSEHLSFPNFPSSCAAVFTARGVVPGYARRFGWSRSETPLVGPIFGREPTKASPPQIDRGIGARRTYTGSERDSEGFPGWISESAARLRYRLTPVDSVREEPQLPRQVSGIHWQIVRHQCPITEHTHDTDH